MRLATLKAPWLQSDSSASLHEIPRPRLVRVRQLFKYAERVSYSYWDVDRQARQPPGDVGRRQLLHMSQVLNSAAPSLSQDPPARRPTRQCQRAQLHREHKEAAARSSLWADGVTTARWV